MLSEEQALWLHMAELVPQLRSNVLVVPQEYRSERWYLLHDNSNGRFMRINQSAYQIIARLNGRHTLTDVLFLCNKGHGDDPIESGDIIKLFSQLHEAEFLKQGLPVSTENLLVRHHNGLKKRRINPMSNPLAIKVPLYDPNLLLTRIVPPLGIFFSKFGVLLWVVIIVLAITVGLTNSLQLSADISAIALGPFTIICLAVLYPVIKLFHEFSHGVTIKFFGGEVHEVGINFLLFFPVPYVDGSASWAFRNKYKRALVGAAGVLTELFIAALALILWSLIEPGIAQDMALYCFTVASISTLVFNANPLLRFDGYYVLEDLVEIPNLSTRASRYYRYLLQRYLLSIESANSPVTAVGERNWFVFYGAIAPLYRLVVLFSIASYLMTQYLVVGVILACWAGSKQLLLPLYHGVKFLVCDPQMATKKSRALWVSVCASALVVGLLNMPLALTTQAQGVVWLGDDSRIVARVSGFVTPESSMYTGQVTKGQVLFQLTNDELSTEQHIFRSKLRELRTKLVSLQRHDRIKSQMVIDEITALQAQVLLNQQHVDKLTVRAKASGQFILTDTQLRKKGFVRQGELLGYIIHDKFAVVRVVIAQEKVGLLKTGTLTAQVMFAHAPGLVINGQVIRQLPSASRALPSVTLGMSGGGKIKQDQQDSSGLTAASDFFVIDVLLPEILDSELIMSRAYVRLNHGTESLGEQMLRHVQQLFLRQISS